MKPAFSVEPTCFEAIYRSAARDCCIAFLGVSSLDSGRLSGRPFLLPQEDGICSEDCICSKDYALKYMQGSSSWGISQRVTHETIETLMRETFPRQRQDFYFDPELLAAVRCAFSFYEEAEDPSCFALKALSRSVTSRTE